MVRLRYEDRPRVPCPYPNCHKDFVYPTARQTHLMQHVRRGDHLPEDMEGIALDAYVYLVYPSPQPCP